VQHAGRIGSKSGHYLGDYWLLCGAGLAQTWYESGICADYAKYANRPRMFTGNVRGLPCVLRLCRHGIGTLRRSEIEKNTNDLYCQRSHEPTLMSRFTEGVGEHSEVVSGDTATVNQLAPLGPYR
jgi:hypothetical protein